MQTTAPLEKPRTNSQLLTRFITISVVMYLCWFFGYQQWLLKDGRLDQALCIQIADTSVAVLQLFGFPAGMHPTLASEITMAGQPAVIVGVPCNGLVLYALFSGFVLAFPGPLLRKLWFIPLGIALIWVLNIIRVAVLAINHYYAHQTVDFNHHYTFTFVVYSFIFGLWMLWARRLSIPAHSPVTDATANA